MINHNPGGPGPSAANMPQTCFRITRRQQKRLDRLGRIERRKLPGIMRLSLDHALNVWDATHPAPAKKTKSHREN